jgi:hypothetical protein
MPLSDEERRCYQRGYQRGARWPLHSPPLPPDEIASKIIDAAMKLRNAVDGQLAMFDEDDEMAATLYPYIDALDAAMTKLSGWLRDSAVLEGKGNRNHRQ